MKKDLRIQCDVIKQLKKDLSFHSAQIGVAVKNAMVLLSGVADTHYRKAKAVNAAKSVGGVKAVAVDIQVDDSPGFGRTDFEIAEAVVNALSRAEEVPIDRLIIQVERRIVTVEGEVIWEYQFTAVEKAIENLGITGIIKNHVTVKPEVKQLINHHEGINKKI